MKLYFAGSTKDDFEPIEVSDNKNILLSFFYYKGAMKKYIDNNYSRFDNLLLDSGAFSFYNSGKEICLNKYVESLKESPFKKYFNLDVIGDAEGSFLNYKKMLELNTNPIPVFHADTNLKYLQKYLDSTDFISVGGLVGNKNIERNLDVVFSEIDKGGYDVSVHGLGLTSVPILKKYPFYSVDSTSYVSIIKFARVQQWCGNEFKTFNTLDFFSKKGAKFKDGSTSGYRYFLLHWQQQQYISMINYVNEYRNNKTHVDDYLTQLTLF
tara:strand:- start:1373 stop:2173 length:801 start_codon:yes stop_codon:yes gene_type:complete